MINIFSENQGEKYEFFELLRMLFPELENSEESIELHINERDILVKLNSKIFKYTLDKFKSGKGKKREIKQLLFDNLPFEKNNGTWGILTGIRPAKIALSLLENYDLDNAYRILVDQYRISDESAKLILNIALREKKYLYPLDSKKYSIYIHIPFCPSICSYCSFQTILNSNKNIIDGYTDKILEEIDCFGRYISGKPHTLYIGGGTPTSIPNSNLEKIINKVQSVFGEAEEFTVEAGRPDTINEDKLRLLKNCGVNRISINSQSFKQETLAEMGRLHNISQIYNSFELANKVGIPIINTDLILGLPKENMEDVAKTLNEVFKLKPDNISLHTLAIKRRSKLINNGQSYKNNNMIMEALEMAKKLLIEQKYFPYYMYRQKRMVGSGENIGYSTLGNECVYNMLIMEEKESVLGFGLGSSSKFFYPNEDRLEKFSNYKDLKYYFENEYKDFAKRVDNISKLKL